MKNPDMIICRCEEVSYRDLINTATTYECTARELKLRTRAGMGYCGGRTCRSMVDKAANTNATVKIDRPAAVSLKYQPPVRPVSFADIGGES